MLLLTDSFLKKEYKPLKRYYTLKDLERAALKIDIKPIYLSNLGYKNGQLLKLRMPSRVAGRLIVYVFIKEDLKVPLVIRLKTDKVFGENLSLNNKRGKALILKMMDLAIDDIRAGRFTKL